MRGTYIYGALTPLERSFVESVGDGETWSSDYHLRWLTDHPGETSNPEALAAVAPGQPELSLNAEIIRAVMGGRILAEDRSILAVSPRGLHLLGVIIRGALDLTAVRFPAPLIFEQCQFEAPVVLEDARLGRVNLNDSSIPSLVANRVTLRNELSLERLRDCQFVLLRRATIRGSLHMIGASLIGDTEIGRALDCSDATILGSVDLRSGFSARGEVRFVGAKIGGNLFCSRSTFVATRSGRALYCNNAKIAGSVFFGAGFEAHGEVNLVHAVIGGRLDCSGGIFSNPVGPSLNCDTVTVGGGVFLRQKNGIRFSATGGVLFHNATVSGEFVCSHGAFERGDCEVAIDCNQITIGRDLLLDGAFQAKGAVDFGGATIRGRVLCDKGVITADGVIDALGERPRPALNFGAADVGASIQLGCGFRASGRVNLARVQVKGNLSCHAQVYDGQEDEIALDLHSANIIAVLYLTRIIEINGWIDLRDTHCGAFADDGSSWRRKSSLGKRLQLALSFGTRRQRRLDGRHYLDGFRYETFTDDVHSTTTDLSARTRLAWLKMQPRRAFGRLFLPQPFTQCARVLRSMGHRQAADEILMHREALGLKTEKLPVLIWLWGQFVGILAGHGQKLHRMLNVLVVIWLAGAALYAGAYCDGRVRMSSVEIIATGSYQKTKAIPEGYEPFVPLVYSLDVLLPVLDLSQERYWLPKNPEEKSVPPKACDFVMGQCFVGNLVAKVLGIQSNWTWYIPKFFYWFEIVAGWLFTTVLVSAFAGLIGNPSED